MKLVIRFPWQVSCLTTCFLLSCGLSTLAQEDDPREPKPESRPTAPRPMFRERMQTLKNRLEQFRDQQKDLKGDRPKDQGERMEPERGTPDKMPPRIDREGQRRIAPRQGDRPSPPRRDIQRPWPQRQQRPPQPEFEQGKAQPPFQPQAPSDPQRRLEHLRIAIDHLHAAQLHDVAERLQPILERLKQQLEPRRPANPRPPEGLEGMMRQMQDRMNDLSRAVQDLRRRVEELTVRREPRER